MSKQNIYDNETYFEGYKQIVVKYHRKFSSVMNSLINAGFSLQKLIEPYPTEEMVKEHPSTADLRHKPDFLVVKAGK